MSTVPEAVWPDADLRPAGSDEPVRLTDAAGVADDPEDYEPGPAHPGDQAAEADVIDQAAEVPLDDEDDE
ncbi:MAG: hypothetical protein FWF02_02255 [Micrococcales bacterium]|nr:hypothetical protein [Micrococcales bacterium]MCL2666514.1 hypothetical protein [Micrococcales bacterium]